MRQTWLHFNFNVVLILSRHARATKLNFQFQCCDVHGKSEHKLIPNIEIGGWGDYESPIESFGRAFILVPIISPMYGLPIIAFSYTVQQKL